MNRTLRVLASASALLLFAALVHWCFTEKVEGQKKEGNQGKLLEFSWVQLHENTEGCFYFRFRKKSSQDDETLSMQVFDCEFWDEDGKLVECENVPVGESHWKELETELNRLELSEYQPPDPYLLDGTDSMIETAWQKNGKIEKKQYNGEFEGTFLKTVKKLVKEIVR